MSFRMWQNAPEVERSRGAKSALLRPVDHWTQIFATQTTTPQEAAARILGDLICFTADRKGAPREGFFGDVEQVAAALEAYAAFVNAPVEAAQ